MAKKNDNELINLLMKNSDSKLASVMDKSEFFMREPEFITTDVPMLNVALSGQLKGGLSGGVLTIAGASKRFKTLFGLFLVKAFQDKYENGVTLFYDTEFGTPPEYLTMYGLDKSKIIHIPIACVEELKHEVSAQLDGLREQNNPDLKVMIFIDSIGSLASRKEINDAVDGKEKADMTRAKQLKSFFRIVTSNIKILDIPMVCINHTYKSQSFIPEEIVSGGTGIMYSSDNVWVVGRRKAEGGNEFVIRVNKSRFVKEKSVIPIVVMWNEGIIKYSGLKELAEEFGLLKSIRIGRSKGWEWNGHEIPDNIIDTEEEFWKMFIEETDIDKRIQDKYLISMER